MHKTFNGIKLLLLVAKVMIQIFHTTDILCTEKRCWQQDMILYTDRNGTQCSTGASMETSPSLEVSCETPLIPCWFTKQGYNAGSELALIDLRWRKMSRQAPTPPWPKTLSALVQHKVSFLFGCLLPHFKILCFCLPASHLIYLKQCWGANKITNNNM